MAKSFRKQCRKPKPKQRQTGHLVVVSPQTVLQHQQPRAAGGASSSHKSNSTCKGIKDNGSSKKKRKKNYLNELLRNSDNDNDSSTDDFDTLINPSGTNESCNGNVLFASTQHSKQQRLCYLLSTRPSRRGASINGLVAAGGDSSSGSSINGGEDVGGIEEGGCHAVVFVDTAAMAQELLGQLKALMCTVFALHERTPKAQAQDHIKRFLTTTPPLSTSSVLILTTAAVARQPSLGPIPKKVKTGVVIRAVHFDASEGPKAAAARARLVGRVFGDRQSGPAAQEVHLEGSGDAAVLPPFEFDRGAMDGVRSRYAVAKKLARAQAGSAGDGEERGMQRAAAAAGLEWDDDAMQSGEGALGAVKRERRRAQAQQATALREKLKVLMCQPLFSNSRPATAFAPSSIAASIQQPQQSSKEVRKKMTLLGMITGGVRDESSAAINTNTNTTVNMSAKGAAAEDRSTAQTRWLDGSSGRSFGGEWEGAVRNGASIDAASLEIRSRLEAAKSRAAASRTSSNRKLTKKNQSDVDGISGPVREGNGGMPAALMLDTWKPNPDTPDVERWGGRWGKPCGHNEVVLQYLRPFAPMEVLNTRVCSKASPAPGNTGFDGCLELLCLTCKAHKRSLTVWDDTAFMFIDRRGECWTLPKRALLPLPLPRLRFLMKNMRNFTVCCEGQTSPRELAWAVMYSAGWGAKQARIGPLTADLSTRVMSFVLSGDLATWRAVSVGVGDRSGKRGAWGIGEMQGGKQREKLSFASKKKRHNFNL